MAQKREDREAIQKIFVLELSQDEFFKQLKASCGDPDKVFEEALGSGQLEIDYDSGKVRILKVF